MTKADIQKEKKTAGEKAAEIITDNMTVGIGTGSTVYYSIQKIGEMIKDGLKIKCVSTSNETTKLALSLKIPLVSLNEIENIDLTIDGADEVDPDLNGIKGGGGALLIEKIVALNSKEIIWVIDSTKRVKKLGKFPLPVEVLPFGYNSLLEKLAAGNFNPVLRKTNNEFYVSDSGNYIIDLHLNEINNPLKLHEQLKAMTGVVETGLFINLAGRLIVATKDKVDIIERNKVKK